MAGIFSGEMLALAVVVSREREARLSEFLEDEFYLLFSAIAFYAQQDSFSGFSSVENPVEIVVRSDRGVVNGYDDVDVDVSASIDFHRANSRFRGGTSGHGFANDNAFDSPFGRLMIWQDTHAKSNPLYSAFFYQLRNDSFHRVDRNRKPNARALSRGTDDGSVDPDQASGRIE